ncbi:MAG: LLM class flavin-dependent oxidoreductase, partial [Micromonosporaceae bacterium]
MRFVLGPLGTDSADGAEHADALVTLATTAEVNGFDGILIAESRLPEDDGWAAGFTLAMRLAQHTSAIRLGVQFAPDVTNPVYHAEEAAVLDALSHGRAMALVRRATGEELSRLLPAVPGDRDTRYAEAVEILLRSWHPNPFAVATEHYRYPAKAPGNAFAAGVDEISVTPKPTQLAMPAWLVAAGRDDLDLARRLDMPPAFAPGTPPSGPLSVARPAIAVRELVLADDTDSAWRAALPVLEHRYGRSGTAPGDWADVAVAGSVDDVVAQLSALRRTGIGVVACRPLWPSATLEETLTMIRFFGAAVVPEFRMST